MTSDGHPEAAKRMTLNAYDEVPYTSYPYPRTHPDRLCTLGRLFGMTPADPEHCRILELGCGAGGNIIPMAEQLPRSELVGIDLSARQIADARAMAGEVGLPNLRLVEGSILDVDETWGTFDYVICHGVYSWVPPEVQRHILEILGRNLRPQGIGYVSYNVYPGWHMREMVRHMMRYHARQFDAPRQRIEQARALLDFLAASVRNPQGAYGQLLRAEIDLLQRTGDDYLYHEHLEDANVPVYFHEFVERLEQHQLQYLCETDLHTMLSREMSPEATETLGRITRDLVGMEQYMDFVRNRQFRATLVCHRAVELERHLRPSVLEGLRVEFGTKPAAPVDLSPGVVVELETLEGLVVRSSTPLTKAALVVLRNLWPRSLPFDQLFRRASDLLREGGLPLPPEPDGRHRLGSDLLECLVGGGLQVHTFEPPMATTVGPRPRVPRSVAVGAHRGFATSQRHARVDLDATAVRIVQLLDGTRDHGAIAAALVEQAQRGTFPIERDGQPVTDPSTLREVVESRLASTLQSLASFGVLVADP